MKIAFVTQDGLSTVNFCTPFVQELGDTNPHGIEMWTISSSDLYANEIRAWGTPHIDIDVGRFVNPISDMRYAMRLFRIFRSHAFDAIVSFGTKPNVWAPLAARMAGIPSVIFAVRGLGRVFSPDSGLRAALIRPILEWFYRASSWASNRVWFTNADDRQYFVKRGIVSADRTFMTPNAVNLKKFAPEAVDPADLVVLRRELGISSVAFVVVMVARMVWTKGVREFVEAAKLVHSQVPDIEFLLVGSSEPGSPNAIPESWIRKAVDSRHIKWTGFRKDIAEVYAISDVSVLPSYYKEGGYPRALLEPMALAKPVIAGDTPDCRAPVEHERNGFVIPVRDAGALAERVLQLYQDPELRKRMGEHSLRRIQEKFDDRIVARTVLQEIINLGDVRAEQSRHSTRENGNRNG